MRKLFLLIALFLISLACSVTSPATPTFALKKVVAATGAAQLTQPAPLQQNNPKKTPTTNPSQSGDGHLVPVDVLGARLDTITSARTAPDGNLWLSTKSGVYRLNEQKWEKLLERQADVLLGADKSGKMWVLLEGGKGIANSDGVNWDIAYPAEGWIPLTAPDYLSPGILDGVETDRDGFLWLATGRDDLRRYDAQSGQWKIFTHADLGFPPFTEKDYQGYFITDVGTSNSGNVWVSACLGKGEVLEGRGIVHLMDGKWTLIEATKDDCVMDMDVDSKGLIYAGTYNNLLVFDPVTAKWKRIPLPKADRSQLATSLELDTREQPWVAAQVAGGASLFGSTRIYHYDPSAGFTLVSDSSQSLASSIAPDIDGSVYFSLGGEVYRWKDQKTSLLDKLNVNTIQLAIDGSNTVWAAALDGNQRGLWKIQP